MVLRTPGRRVSARLPDFPWDSLAAHKAKASAHPDGLVDLSVGTPVDQTPEVARAALAAATDWPGYPVTIGLERTRQAVNAIETGKHDPSLPLAFRIARLFELNIEDIFDDGETA